MDEHTDNAFTRPGIESEQPCGLRRSQSEARHFIELGADPLKQDWKFHANEESKWCAIRSYAHKRAAFVLNGAITTAPAMLIADNHVGIDDRSDTVVACDFVQISNRKDADL